MRRTEYWRWGAPQILQQVSSEEGARAAAALEPAPASPAVGAQLGALGDFLLARLAHGV